MENVKKTRIRVLSILLAMAMVITMMPMTVLAEETNSISTEGDAGDTIMQKTSAVDVTTLEGLESAIANAQAGTESVINLKNDIVLTKDLLIPEDKIITLSSEEADIKLTTGEEYTILVSGCLNVRKLKIGGDMNPGYAPITLNKDGAKLYADEMTLENSGQSANGFDVSAQGIQISTEKRGSAASPKNCVIELNNSCIQVNGSGARGICFAGTSDNTSVTLNNTDIFNGNNSQNEWLGGYSRGIALFNASNMTVNILNGSQIAGFQYAINSGRNQETDGLEINVKDSDIRGWTSFNIWSDGGEFQVENSTLTGMNGSYNGDKTYSFSAFVINRDIYNKGWGIAENNHVVFKNTTINAITEDGQPTETLIRIDVDSTDVELQGTITIKDNTHGLAGAAFDIGNMDDPTAFMERHADITDGVTVNTPDGNPLWPTYEVKNTFGDGEISFGESFANFISGVDYEAASDNNEKVILLRDVNEPEFSVNSEKGHGNEYGGWVLDLDGHKLTLAGWDADKVKIMDSSENHTGDIIVNGESVLIARNGDKCYTDLTDAVKEAEKGDTITILAKEIELTQALDIDKDLIIEGNGATITADKCVGLYIKNNLNNLTVRNLTLKGVEDEDGIAGEGGSGSFMGIGTYDGGYGVGKLTLSDVTIDGFSYGLYFGAKTDNTAQVSVDADNMTIQNCYIKGAYFEKLTDSDFNQCSFLNNGKDAAKVEDNFKNWVCGVDVNLKNGQYEDISFNNCEFTENGANRGTALHIKARGTGSDSSYRANPASLENVTITGCTFEGNNSDAPVVFGEPEKGNTSPVNISIQKDVDFTNNLVDVAVVTFDSNEGSDVPTQIIKKNSSISNLPAPTRSGYSFLGWYTKTSGGEEVTAETTFEANTVVYAQWSKNSSSGGGSSSGNKTETVTNPDGSTTTTVTKPDGSKTETTKYPDGSSSVTTTAADGKTEYEVEIPQSVIDAAAEDNAAVVLPMPEVSASKDKETAPEVTVNLPAGTSAKVEVPVKDVTPGTVAVLVKEDGTEEIIKTSLTTENGVEVTVNAGDTIKIIDNSKEFSDVDREYWGADAIDFVTSRELFNGTGETTFSPESDMTRAMIVTVLARYEGVDTSAGDEWYEAGARWAVENGISDGTNLDAFVTREQLVTMLYRYAGEPEVTGDLGDFTDKSSVSDWAYSAMVWGIDQGLINGMGDGSLNPQGKATRAQVAAILARFVEATN